MSVYVDSLRPCLTSSHWRYSLSCHLFADTVAELHSFAKSIGLKTFWFQNRRDFPHYDLTECKREKAIKAGALAIDAHTVVMFMNKQRAKQE